jgi:CRP/FNR family transcriptional regulator, anaerobic regulatory protein
MLPMYQADPGMSQSVVTASPVKARALDGSVMSFARNQLVFEAGDVKRHVFRVESGAVTIYRTRADLTVEVVEHALTGDLIAMGFLDRHTTTARASVDTKLRAFDREDVDALIADDPHNQTRYDDEMQREFVFRREMLSNASRERPVVRLAAFLTAVSRRISDEGGDPTLIDDSVGCGVIADFLGLSVDLLALGLMQLEMRGLVEVAPPHGLRLKDIAALEAIVADETDAMPAGQMAFAQ